MKETEAEELKNNPELKAELKEGAPIKDDSESKKNTGTNRESWSRRTVCLRAGGTLSYKEELEVTKKEELTPAVSGEPKE